jgi:hypothetical protein
LAKLAGASVPARARAILTKRKIAEQKAIEASDLGMRGSPDFQESTLRLAYPAEWAAAMAMSGRQRSDARRALAARYEAANPGELLWVPYLKPAKLT